VQAQTAAAPAPLALPTAPAIRVVIVEDHTLVLQALAHAFEGAPGLDVVGTAASLHDFEVLCMQPRLEPDVVVIDHRLSDGSGIDGCRLLLARWPRAHVLMLSGSGGRSDALAAIEAGADAYLLKTMRLGAMIQSIRAAFAGEILLTPQVLGDIARRLPERSAEEVLTRPLTPRELTVLRLLAHGRSTRAIASELGMTPGTVRVHVEALRRKFQVSSKLEAVSAAIRHRIVEVPLSQTAA
jgi:DNA-binding NarL/FixJ family response regulator